MLVLENTCLDTIETDNKCIKVLLIEDNPDHYYLIREMLVMAKDALFDTERVDRLAKGLECLGKKKYDVVLTDISLPDSLGINTFHEIHAQAPDIPVVVLSALDDEEFATQAVHAGAQDYLVKGHFNAYLLGRAIFYAIERKRVELTLNSERDNLLGILESMQDGVYISNRHHDIEYINPAIKKEFGPVEGRKCYQYFFNMKKICPWCKNQDVFAGKVVHWELYYPKNKKTYDLIDSPLKNPDGSISKLGIFRDITERKWIESTLRLLVEGTANVTGDEYLRSLVRSLASVIGFRYAFVGEIVKPGSDRIKTLAVWANGEYGENFEYDLAGTPCENVTQQGFCYYNQDVRQQFPEDHLLAQMGVESYMGIPLIDSSGDLVGLLVTINDKPMEEKLSFAEHIFKILASRTVAEIERRQAEHALQKSEKQYRKLYEYSVAALWKISIQEGKFLKANLPTAKILGFNGIEDLMENSSFNDLCHPEQRKKLIDKLRVRGELCDYELLFTLKDGTKKYVTACIKIYPEKGYLEGNFVDITKRKHIEEKIEQSYQIKSAVNSVLQISLEPIPLEKLLERVLDIAISMHWLNLQSRGAIFLVEDDPQMLVMKVQRGLSPTHLMNCTNIPFGKCFCGQAAVSHKIEFGSSRNNRHEIQFSGIDPHSHYCVPILFEDKVLGVMVLYSDSTHTRKEEEEETLLAIARALSGIIERKRGEEALKTKQQEIENLNANLEIRVQEEVEKSRQKDFIMMHQSRLAAMGEMIGNIAHQWKQPLNALVFLLYNIQDSFESNELTESELDNWIKKGDKLIRKMASTVDDFRSFFKPNKAKEVFCVNKIIKDSLSLVDAAFRQNSISVVVNEREKTNVFGFANEYSQVILNILNNAKDAIIAKGIDGEIKIDISHDNKFNVLKIKDNGGGIPEEIKNRIFEPYFTTKEEGRGTGIGLYMSKVIIEDHMNGYVEVQNDNGGAEFRITTPSAKQD